MNGGREGERDKDISSGYPGKSASRLIQPSLLQEEIYSSFLKKREREKEKEKEKEDNSESLQQVIHVA